MRRLLCVCLFWPLLTAACGAGAPTSPSTAIPAEQSSASESASPVADSPTATQVGGPEAFVEYQSGALWVHLYSPQDGDVVQSSQITILGEAPAGTVISLNEAIYIVPDDQAIAIPINLDEGPNVLELVASDLSGNEVSFILTLTYEP